MEETLTFSPELRHFLWTALYVHKQKVDRLIEQGKRKQVPTLSLELVALHLQELLAEEPEGSAAFDAWVGAVFEAQRPEAPTRCLYAIDGGES